MRGENNDGVTLGLAGRIAGPLLILILIMMDRGMPVGMFLLIYGMKFRATILGFVLRNQERQRGLRLTDPARVMPSI